MRMGRLIALITLLAGVARADPIVLSEFIFDKAPFASCHASTIVQTEHGLAAAWFGGSKEGAPDVGIWLSLQRDGKWSEPKEVARGERAACWNPVLFQPKGGALLLFYKVGPSPPAWWGMMMSSEDEGATWPKATRLAAGVLGPIKDKPNSVE